MTKKTNKKTDLQRLTEAARELDAQKVFVTEMLIKELARRYPCDVLKRALALGEAWSVYDEQAA